jgi:phosphatidylethanolamine-binding protein (PEBP) family uncharacterized protein
VVPDIVGRLLRPVRAWAQRSRLAALAAPYTLTVCSPAFADGSDIPVTHAGKGVGDNVSPALHWTGVPEDTAAQVLIIEDDDVPLPHPLWHTVAVLGGEVRRLAEGALHPDADGIALLRTPLGRGYSGPRPIPGHGAHHYRFRVFALGEPLSPDLTGRAALVRDLHRKATARGVLTGVYER